MTVWIFAFSGVALTFAVALRYLGLGVADTLVGILVSNIAAFCALMVSSLNVRSRFVKKYIMPNALWTWVAFSVVYFGVLLGFFPPVRSLHRFSYLVMPLIWSTGFAIVVFGPIQDGLMARSQRRAR